MLLWVTRPSPVSRKGKGFFGKIHMKRSKKRQTQKQKGPGEEQHTVH